MTVFGFHGRYRRVDLSRGHVETRAIPPAILRRYLGGVGLGAWLLNRESPPGVDPLSPEAPLIFVFSPLVGTPLTTSAKMAVVVKSPLTGRISDGLSSSHFAIAGKKTGVDAIVIVGQCAQPSALVGDAIEPTDLWGRSAREVDAALRGRGRVAAIGVAGERLVRYATISNDGRHAGRGGAGAVMGSKRLKVIVVDGDQPTKIADPLLVVALARDLSRRSLGPATAKYRELGTAANLAAFNRIAALPTRNFQRSQFAAAERLAPETLQAAKERARATCAACAIGCEHIYESKDGKSARVEYQSLFALGPLCGVEDPELVLEASRRADELGVDTVSAGGSIAFAMECGERGLLTGAPSFGDGEAMLALLDDIAHRRGSLGDLLADGTRRAAERIGGGAIDLAAQVKGLEIPGYEPRALQSMALGFAVGSRGADHNRSGAYEADFSEQVDRLAGDERSAALAVESEDRAALIDSMILCKFVRGVFHDLYEEGAALLHAVTGFDYGPAELKEAARRIVALRKSFNIREGWTPAEDTLPVRFLRDALQDGASKGARISSERLTAMIRQYNLLRGWHADGFLPDALLQELDSDLKTDA